MDTQGSTPEGLEKRQGQVYKIQFRGTLGVLPTALIVRMRRKDPAADRPASAVRHTNWVVRSPPGPAPDSMKRLF